MEMGNILIFIFLWWLHEKHAVVNRVLETISKFS